MPGLFNTLPTGIECYCFARLASMIVFDYDVCPTLFIAAILGEVLRFAMGVHIYKMYSWHAVNQNFK